MICNIHGSLSAKLLVAIPNYKGSITFLLVVSPIIGLVRIIKDRLSAL